MINIGRKLKREIKSKRKTSAIKIPCANCDKMPPLLRRLVYFQQSICEAEKRFLHSFPSQYQVKSLFSMESNSSGLEWFFADISVLFVEFLWIWATDHLFWLFFYDLGAQFLTLPSASFASSALRIKTKYDNAAIPIMTQNIRKSELWNTPQRT